MGVDPAALALLIEHTFPGNDAELRDLLGRAAQVAHGPTVTAADLAAVGFRQRADATPLPTPAPLPAGRRPRLSRGVRRG
jgi:transcriptional regulator of acetoin/glycerol metabolism